MPNTKRAPSHTPQRSENAAIHKHSSGKMGPVVDPPDYLFDELTETRITMLRKVATVATAVAKHHLNNDSFHRLIKFAYDQKVITSDKLAEMGHSDRTSASRWINGHNAPNHLAQRVILEMLASEAEKQARELRNRVPDPDTEG